MRHRTAVALLCVTTAAMAAPYVLAGPNFILDDWFAVRNAMFHGAFAAAGHNQQLARPGAWVVYGLTFGLFGNHPLPIFAVQTAINALVGVALFSAARRLLPAGPAFAVAAVWVVAPTHTSLDNWASAINISVALLAALVGVALLGRSRANWQSALCFAVSALCYEATMPFVALATVALPLLEYRRLPRRVDVVLPAASLAACGLWIVTHWHPDKHIGGWIDPTPIVAAHFGWGLSTSPRVANVLLTATIAAVAIALGRLALPSFRPQDVRAEAMVLAGVVVMGIGLVPFLRYLYEPLGAGDRANVVSSVGGALVLTGIGWMVARGLPGRILATSVVTAAAVAVGTIAVGTNAHRDHLYARAGDDVLRTMAALDRAIPHPDGPIALGPRPVTFENIAGLLDASNVDGALQVHRHQQGVHGYVARDVAAWRRAPAQLRFDQVRLLAGR